MLPVYEDRKDLEAVVPSVYWVKDEKSLDSAMRDLGIVASDYFFRGLSRSSYKLYSSAQQHWAKHPESFPKNGDMDAYWMPRLYALRKEGDHEFVSRLDLLGIDRDDDIAWLSYMQHHQEHTPFLDFSEDPFVALCFAAQEPRSKDGPPVPLDEWFGLYALPRRVIQLFNREFANAIAKHRPRTDLVVGRTYSKYMFFGEGKFLLMYQPWLTEHLGAEYGRIMNNVFIERQKGLFLFHRFPELPFTEALLHYQEQTGMTRGKGRLVSDQLICVNFHRSLAISVRNRLMQLNPPLHWDYIMPSDSQEIS